MARRNGPDEGQQAFDFGQFGGMNPNASITAKMSTALVKVDNSSKALVLHLKTAHTTLVAMNREADKLSKTVARLGAIPMGAGPTGNSLMPWMGSARVGGRGPTGNNLMPWTYTAIPQPGAGGWGPPPPRAIGGRPFSGGLPVLDPRFQPQTVGGPPGGGGGGYSPNWAAMGRAGTVGLATVSAAGILAQNSTMTWDVVGQMFSVRSGGGMSSTSASRTMQSWYGGQIGAMSGAQTAQVLMDGGYGDPRALQSMLGSAGALGRINPNLSGAAGGQAMLGLYTPRNINTARLWNIQLQDANGRPRPIGQVGNDLYQRLNPTGRPISMEQLNASLQPGRAAYNSIQGIAGGDAAAAEALTTALRTQVANGGQAVALNNSAASRAQEQRAGADTILDSQGGRDAAQSRTDISAIKGLRFTQDAINDGFAELSDSMNDALVAVPGLQRLFDTIAGISGIAPGIGGLPGVGSVAGLGGGVGGTLAAVGAVRYGPGLLRGAAGLLNRVPGGRSVTGVVGRAGGAVRTGATAAAGAMTGAGVLRLLGGAAGPALTPNQISPERMDQIDPGGAARREAIRNEVWGDGKGGGEESSTGSQQRTSGGGGGVVRLMRPTAGSISSPFGMRTHPITGERKLHGGIDFRGSTGTAVVAADGGTVVHSGSTGNSWGTYIKIDHGNGLQTLYAHLSATMVSKGARVTRGSRIGSIGATGRVTGPHLHFEVYRNGTRVDPAPFIGGGAPAGSSEGTNKETGNLLAGGSGKDARAAIQGATGSIWSGPSEGGATAVQAHSGGGGGGGTPSLTGNSNAERVFNFLRGSGFTPQAAAGVIGNLMQESRVDPKAVQKNGPGRGIMQWSVNQRWQSLQRWAGDKDPWALDTQVGFMMKEMRDYGVMDDLSKMTNVTAAVRLFQEKMERAGKPHYENRDRYAREALESYGGMKGYSEGARRIEKDQVARLHANEMVVPASMAQELRDFMDGHRNAGGGGGGNSVVINVHVARATDTEAVALARRVGALLQQDSGMATVRRR